MKQIVLFKGNKSLLTRLALLVMMIVVGGGNVWAQKSLPYSYGFENNSLGTEGWTQIDKISSSQIVASGTYGVPDAIVTDSYCFRFSSGYNKTEYLISPLLSSSATGIDVSFYYINTSTSSKEQFQIGYSTYSGEGEPQASSFTWLEEVITPAASMSEKTLYNVTINNSSVKYVAIKHISANSHTVFIDDISIDVSETYKRPKNFVIDSYTLNSVTFSWTPGDDEEEWEIVYSTKADFNPDTEGVRVAVTEIPYTLSGLTEAVTYYAYVRSKYVVDEDNHYSAWSNKLEMTPLLERTVNESGTDKNTSVPIIDRTYSESYMQSQFIIPASDINLAAIQNTTVTKLTFYCSQSTINWNGATFEVYMNEVDKTVFNASSLENFTEWGTKVYNSGTLSVSNGKMVIELDTPYPYTNGNLMIGFKQTHISGEKDNTMSISSSWYGTNQGSSNTAIYYGMGYSSVSTSRAYFIPKVTFTTLSPTIPATIGANGYTTFASPRPLDLSALPNGLTAYKAALDLENSKVLFTEISQAVPANTGMLLKGTANTTYQIPVAVSGTAVASNAFEVNSTGGTFDAESDYTYYALKKNSSPLTFGTFNPASVAIPTNKAYVKVDTSGGVKAFTFEFDDTATAISSLNQAQPAMKGAVYDLSGRRVANAANAQLPKGLYIIDGKKVVIK